MIDISSNDPFSPVSSADSITNYLLWFVLVSLILVFIIIGFLFIAGSIKEDYRLRESAYNILNTFAKIVFFSAALSGILYVSYMYIEAKNEWKEFASQHCSVIEKRDGQSNSGVGVTLSGQIGTFLGSSSPQTVYKCDDGVTYTKND